MPSVTAIQDTILNFEEEIAVLTGRIYLAHSDECHYDRSKIHDFAVEKAALELAVACLRRIVARMIETGR